MVYHDQIVDTQDRPRHLVHLFFHPSARCRVASDVVERVALRFVGYDSDGHVAGDDPAVFEHDAITLVSFGGGLALHGLAAEATLREAPATHQ
jgi:hypothetical protein